MKPLIKNPVKRSTTTPAYEYIDVDEFTPLIDSVVLSEKSNDTSSSAVRLGVDEDNKLVMQRVSVMFGEAPSYQEGYIDLTKDFKIGAEGADFVHKCLEEQGLLFEFVDGLGGTMSSAFIENDTPYEVWYKPSEWLSVKTMPAKRAQYYMDMNGQEVGTNIKGHVKASDLFNEGKFQGEQQ